MPVYGADRVYSDTFNNNQTGAYGILGFGPLSPIWYAYADP